MGNDLQVGSPHKGPAANSLLSTAPVGSESVQPLGDPHELLGLPDRSAQPGVDPQGSIPLLPSDAEQNAGDDIDHAIDDDIDNVAEIGGEPPRGLLVDDHNGENDLAPRGAASTVGPYRESDYIEFRNRHYESAIQVVTSMLGEYPPKNADPQAVAATKNLQKVREDPKQALSDFQSSRGQVAGKRAGRATFKDMATLVGGKHSSTKRGWIRCLFSSNARRARSIQEKAEKGQSFSDIYRGRKVANIHPKAALALFIRGRLKASGLGDQEWAATKEISKQLGREYLKRTERSEAWRTHIFSHSFRSLDGTTSLAMTSKLTPAAQLTALEPRYSESQKFGISSMNSKERNHPANLWMTEFTPAAQSSAKLSFKGFRHGVLDAYGLKDDKDAREKANQAKVAELVRAAGSEMPSVCERQSDGSWLIPMVSVSLQTYGKETDMIEAQKSAWAAVKDVGVEMEGPNPDGSPGPWTLKPSPVTFSIGVNFAAMNWLGQARAWHWSTAEPDNEKAIDTLLQSARAFRDGLSFENREQAIRKKAITELIGQIEAMYEDKSFQSEGQNPYKLAARILLLSQFAGLVPCFNCKSGKDRTGMVDVEVKSLLQSINENIQSHGEAALSAAAVANEPDAPSIVPSYKAGRTPEQKAVFKDLHLNGGSQQVSLATTGLMGNKTASGYLKKNLNRDQDSLRLTAGFARHADGNKA